MRSDDAGDIYKPYNGNPDEYNKYINTLRTDSKKFEDEIAKTGTLKLETTIGQKKNPDNSPRIDLNPKLPSSTLGKGYQQFGADPKQKPETSLPSRKT